MAGLARGKKAGAYLVYAALAVSLALFATNSSIAMAGSPDVFLLLLATHTFVGVMLLSTQNSELAHRL